MDVDLRLGDSLEILKEFKNESVDLVVTSPPYDNLRTYKDSLEWNFEIFSKIANELSRVLKKGGVIVWVVGDATIKGSETGSSFRQALYFKDSCGLNIHDTMIYEKNSSTFPARANSNRYTQIFEYMFILSKGKPKGNLICDKANKWAGHKDFSGKLKNPVPDYSPRNNIWKYTTSFNGFKHPAVFPIQLTSDHIVSWSRQGDTVLDPFMGSGTTGASSKLLGRNFIGIEKVPEYFNIAKERLSKLSK